MDNYSLRYVATFFYVKLADFKTVVAPFNNFALCVRLPLDRVLDKSRERLTVHFVCAPQEAGTHDTVTPSLAMCVLTTTASSVSLQQCTCSTPARVAAFSIVAQHVTLV